MNRIVIAAVIGVVCGFITGCLEPIVRVVDPVDGGVIVDGGTSCATDRVACGAACVDLQSDDANCGRCGNACGADQRCVKAACYARRCAGAECAAAQVCVNDRCTDSRCVGVMCTAGQVCNEGACVPGGVMCGAQTCLPSQACLQGQCIDPSCVGVRCPSGTTCLAGQCVAGCVGGATCTPSTECRSGTIACDGGAQSCATTGNLPTGMSCGMNRVCSSTGTCGDCTVGTSCDAGACVTGAVACGTGAPVCGASSNVAGGTSCGVDQVCSGMGACVGCTQGTSCDAGTCTLGSVSCATGGAVCQRAGPAPAGVQCGATDFCDADGGCLPCTNGSTCSLTSAPCITGSLVCGATPTCNPLGVRAPGTTCGANQVCAVDGGCIGCQQAAGCDAGVCRSASIACATGAPACVVAANLPRGQQATPALVCDGDGGEVGCAVGTACDAGVCLTAQVQCSTGAASCGVTMPVAAGTMVGANQFCDGDGGVGGCTAGAACNTSNPCENGQTSCATGAPVCVPVSGAGQLKASSVQCRAAGTNSTCDPAEFCTGSSVSCPANAVAPMTTACGSANATACDAADSCDGAGACVARVKATGTSCRTAGANPTCDPAELCDGASAPCPVDAFASNGASCGSSSNLDCDAPDSCNGTGACIARFKSGTVCRGTGTDPTCEPAVTCPGNTATCPASNFASSFTPCGDQSNLDCDAPDTCNGFGACAGRFKSSGVVCRSAGANATCNPAEACNGFGASCPADFTAFMGTACTTANGAGTCQVGGSCLTSPQFIYNGLCGTNPQVASNGTEFNCGPAGPFALNFPTCTGATACTLGERCMTGSGSDPFRNINTCVPGGQVWVSRGPGIGQCGYPATQSCASVLDQSCGAVAWSGAGSACTSVGATCVSVSSYELAGDGTLAMCAGGPCFTKGRLFVCVNR